MVDKLRDLRIQLDKGTTPNAGYAHYIVRPAAQDWLAHGLDGRSPKFAEHTIEAVRYTACPDRSWLGGLYDYGHGEPAVTEYRADIGGPWLTVGLPASTRIRLTLTLALRTRPASYAAPFGRVGP